MDVKERQNVTQSQKQRHLKIHSDVLLVLLNEDFIATVATDCWESFSTFTCLNLLTSSSFPKQLDLSYHVKAQISFAQIEKWESFECNIQKIHSLWEKAGILYNYYF